MNQTLAYFEKINMIPRESGNEMALSDYIRDWASEQGFDVAQDEYYNLLIKKPASQGYENHEPVMLQAHMDMVCEKTPESTHDFSKDPIILKEVDGWITSACGTSLGADNGIGVSAAMAILADEAIAHPPLEVAFTVEEETTFSGADNISAELFKSKRMINLDHACDEELIVGSCGGQGMAVRIPMEFRPLADSEAASGKSFKLKVSGLLGGHSGEDIHRGNGNAIKLLGRLLKGDIKSSCEMEIASINAGTNRLAIPREAEAVVLCQDEGKLREHAKAMKMAFAREYGKLAPELDITVSEMDEALPVLNPESKLKLMRAIELFPDGITNMNGRFPGMVECSNNLGIVELEADKLILTTEVRGMYESTVEALAQKIDSLAELLGAEVEVFAKYVPWEFSGESELRSIALEIHKEAYGKEMRQLALHAGLECGSFVAKRPGMDVISMGPDCMYFHSVNEKVRIDSVDKFYDFLIKILARL